MWREIVAKDGNGSRHAFMAQNAHFGVPAGRHLADDQADTFLDEVHELDRPALLFKAIAQSELDWLQMG
jgi:hypothetical protein